MIPAPKNLTMFEVFKAVKARLDEANLAYDTTSYRDDAFSFLVHAPGYYWEIDIREDGAIDIETFKSHGMADDPWAAIDQLVDDHKPAITTKPKSSSNDTGS